MTDAAGITTSSEELYQRATGALLGVAIGDAMGASLEGRSAAEIRAQYGRLSGFVDEKPAGTDDTDFTLFNAYLLITYGAQITLEQVQAEWQDKLLGAECAYRPGGFSDVIATRNLRLGLQAPFSGRFGQQMWSDGVAMAISPAGIIAAGRPELAAQLAHTLGSVSNGRDGLWAAQAVAAAVAAGMSGAAPEAMMQAALSAVPAGSWTGRCLRRVAALFPGPATDPDAEHLDEILERLSLELVVDWWPWADLATEAVPLAFGAFLAARGDFASALPAAISLGRDADTIGAIVGGLAGVYQGLDGIPAAWVQQAQLAPGKCIGFVAGMDIAQTARLLVDRRVQAEQQ